MDSEGIVSMRTALRYLKHGDDPAKRARLAVILLAMLILAGVIVASLVLVITHVG